MDAFGIGCVAASTFAGDDKNTTDNESLIEMRNVL